MRSDEEFLNSGVAVYLALADICVQNTVLGFDSKAGCDFSETPGNLLASSRSHLFNGAVSLSRRFVDATHAVERILACLQRPLKFCERFVIHIVNHN